jgi:hypothetical protein
MMNSNYNWSFLDSPEYVYHRVKHLPEL